MNLLLSAVAVLFASITYSKDLPSWVERQAKLQAYEQLAQWSSVTKPYVMSGTEALEEKNLQGELTQKIEINLQTAECKQQKLATSCLPVGLHTENPALFCNMTLVDCAGSKLSKMMLVKQ